MLIRSITLNTNPVTTIALYFDSVSNAEKPMDLLGDEFHAIQDDYGQKFILRRSLVACDLIENVPDSYRAAGERKLCAVKAEMKFEERIDKDPQLKTRINQKRAQEMMARMQRVDAPANPGSGQ